MRILKRNGRSEFFEIEKVKTSIANASCDIGVPLTEGDLKMLAQEIEKILFGLREASLLTSSYEVRGVTFHVLVDCGFSDVAKSYMMIRP